MNALNEKQFECCPPFNPEPWDDKIIEWNDKPFIRGNVKTLFYMPLNFGKEMKRFDQAVKAASANVVDYLCLSEHTSKWNMDLYLAVDKIIPGEKNITKTGRFFSKVYEGPFREMGKWHKEFISTVKSKGFSSKRTFMWYTTCPKCAKKYGKNYTVFLSELQ